MYMTTTSSPRWTRSGIRRRPIKPVPPATKVVMGVPPDWSDRSVDLDRSAAQRASQRLARAVAFVGEEAAAAAARPAVARRRRGGPFGLPLPPQLLEAGADRREIVGGSGLCHVRPPNIRRAIRARGK